jgi:hypothetical protein
MRGALHEGQTIDNARARRRGATQGCDAGVRRRGATQGRDAPRAPSVEFECANSAPSVVDATRRNGSKEQFGVKSTGPNTVHEMRR